MKKRYFISSLLAVLATTAVYANDVYRWALVKEWSSGMIFVDTLTIHKDQKSARFWARLETTKIKACMGHKYTGAYFYEASCEERRIRLLQASASCSKNGKSESQTMPGAWGYVEPTSPLESALQFACANLEKNSELLPIKKE
jgi:hypothetical protein